jgi:hypothetical protein
MTLVLPCRIRHAKRFRFRCLPFKNAGCGRDTTAISPTITHVLRPALFPHRPFLSLMLFHSCSVGRLSFDCACAKIPFFVEVPFASTERKKTIEPAPRARAALWPEQKRARIPGSCVCLGEGASSSAGQFGIGDGDRSGHFSISRQLADEITENGRRELPIPLREMSAVGRKQPIRRAKNNSTTGP